MARDIAIAHHEKWDGNGYPNGLAGENIPVAARIVALADVYDALTSRRVYREPMSHAQARGMILQERGAHFDPDVVEAFVATEPQFAAIKERFRDSEPSPAAPVAEAPPLPPIQPQVLIVDDDPGTLHLLTHYLDRLGMEHVCCCDGQAALTMLETYQPKLIISDWEMPGIDGLELCRRVRARPGGNHLHFIMLTIHAAKEDLCKAFDAGVDDFLGKPFDEADLMARLRAAMRAVALHDELSRKNIGSQRLNAQLTNLNQRLEKLAITDDLTGLYNRREAMHRLEEHWAMCERYQRPVAAVMLDLDHFKRINDVHGHPAGDMVLKQLAEILGSCVRASDVVCRVGGEEFLVILPCQSQLEAQTCAERCRQAVAAHQFDIGESKIRATISAGVAMRQTRMTQCPELLEAADQALYAAKRSGRNAVCCAATDPHQASPSAA
jgi:diguanylate cyclase (GGDEF)-like protein